MPFTPQINSQLEEMDVEEGHDVSVQNAVPMEASNEVQEEIEDSAARSEASFTFRVENISRLREQVLSQPTYVRNLPWRIMVMPRSDQGAGRNMSLGFFLQCNGEAESSSWNCSAVATLRIMSQKPGVEPFHRSKISHIFHSKENDWGYSNFIDWPALMDPSKGYVKNDYIELEVDVKADAPHGVAWDSKKHTGYVGLKNQGATCYMNSLLQTLYFTNQLRKAVYKMPTESDDSTKSVALALQRVFYELQTSDKPVGTKKLTRSFGWETLDSFMQHDVQEFLRVLLDKLESKMKGTCVEGTVPKLFEGKMISFIKCKHVKYESSRTETFYDIQLNIKGKKDLYESFRDYVATEVLDGDNKYDAGAHGLQEAEKGVIFTSFPPILHLHLMRFQYDPVTDCSVKSNDRFEFFEKIQLDEFVKDKDSPQPKPTYTLHAVLVHSGDNHGGHYVVFLNPRGDGKWCKFDDDVVSRCTKTEAIQHNFGGQEMDDLHPGVKQSTNAYMLVYIRDSNLPDVLQEVTEDDIPRELLERLKEEKNIEILKRKERSEAHLYMQLTVMLEDAFVGHQGFDLFDQEKMSPAATANSRTFRVLKKTKPHEFLKTLSETFNVDTKRLRLWPFNMRVTKVIRPIHLDVIPETSKTLEETIYGHQLPIFLEILPNDDERDGLPPFDKENDVILFLKMYDPVNESLHYFGHWCVPISTSFNDLAAECRKRANYSDDTSITLYEEVSPGSVEKVVDMNATLEHLTELMDGDIVVFHKTYDPTRKLKSVTDYYIYMQYMYEITFVDKSNTNESFTLEMSLKSSYMEMAAKVGQRLGVNPLYIQFYRSQPYKDSPAFPIKFEQDSTDLLTKLAPVHKPTRSPYKLFYQVLGIPVTELEHKKQFKLLYYSPDDQAEREVVFYVNKAPRIIVADVLTEMSKVVSEDHPVTLRLLEISAHRIVSVIENEISADIITNNNSPNRYYRAEEIPDEEKTIGPNEVLVQVAHFHKEARSTFGIPFLIKVRYGETWSAVKQKIQNRLGVNEKDWAKIKVALVSQGTPVFLEKDEDETAVKPEHFQSYSQAYSGKPWLGVDHVNKAPKRSRYSTLEKAIKIYN
ncbi:Ubiquitin carboxyl-terminal hydrolase 7 [Orchesella cincta]|uniref:Ubiquitin carboxyl-terminal hydrolase 7 n=1 Tax=Orchesella cincta TaxID=48709 RepID=A0A1D2NDG3_ORCCI|nr:Ubiquitin carboxyl-terminal hydrolase 7 [Orchesella cincta]